MPSACRARPPRSQAAVHPAGVQIENTALVEKHGGGRRGYHLGEAGDVEDGVGADPGAVVFVGEAAQRILQDDLPPARTPKAQPGKAPAAMASASTCRQRRTCCHVQQGRHRAGFGLDGFASIVSLMVRRRGILRDKPPEGEIGTILGKQFVYQVTPGGINEDCGEEIGGHCTN